MFGISRKELRIFLEKSLSRKEKEVFLACCDFQGLTFSQIVSKLSKSYSPSTAKFVLKNLKDYKLVEFGDYKNKGRPFVLTKLGLEFSKILEAD